jgi:hypothetical protein
MTHAWVCVQLVAQAALWSLAGGHAAVVAVGVDALYHHTHPLNHNHHTFNHPLSTESIPKYYIL